MKKNLTPNLTPGPFPKREGESKWQEQFEAREDGELHCRLCMACFPVHSPERARNHLWIKHGIEIGPDVVVIKKSRELPAQTFEFMEQEE